MKTNHFAKVVHPTPEQVLEAREAAGLTQKQAAELVHRVAAKRWSEWERGTTHMQADAWELFLLKTGLKRLGG